MTIISSELMDFYDNFRLKLATDFYFILDELRSVLVDPSTGGFGNEMHVFKQYELILSKKTDEFMVHIYIYI